MTENEGEMPVMYAELASAGASRSTEAGRASAKQHFQLFLRKQQLGEYQSLTEDQLCNEKLFREFATYLSVAEQLRVKELLKSGSAIQYLSAIKEMAQRKYPENDLWKEHRLDRWYPSLRVALEKIVNRRQMTNGLPISERSKALGRNVLTIASETLMKDGRMEAMKRRLAIVMTFLAVGRAGEAACSTWASASWDYERGNLLMDWSELKTGLPINNTFHCFYDIVLNKIITLSRRCGSDELLF